MTKIDYEQFSSTVFHHQVLQWRPMVGGSLATLYQCIATILPPLVDPEITMNYLELSGNYAQ